MNKKLEQEVWYRLFKVIAIAVIVLSFFAPLYRDYAFSNGLWIVSGIINVIGWTLVFWVFKKVIVYVFYGRNSVEKDIQSDVKNKVEKKFNLSESWSFPLGLLSIFGVTGFLLGLTESHPIKGLMFGLLGAFILLIVIYAIHALVTDKK